MPVCASGADRELSLVGALHSFSANTELGRRVGEPGRQLENSLGGGVRMTQWLLAFDDLPFNVAAEAEALWLPSVQTSPAVQGGVAGTERRSVATFAARAHALVAVGGDQWQALAVLGVGAAMIASKNAVPAYDTDSESHVGLGVRFLGGNHWSLRADVRAYSVSSASKTARFALDTEALLSAGWRFGAAKQPVAPPVVTDSDGDGIDDEADVCPFVAETRNGIRDGDGCPEDAAVLAHGASTTDIEAPVGEGEETAEHWSKTLPPLQQRGDADGDGIWGDDDQCPDAKEDADGFDDLDGCPDLDDDGDGVPDAADKCRLEAETLNGYQDGDGCPDDVPKQLKQFTGVIEGITFKTKSHEIAKKSAKTLLAAAKVLTEYEQVRLEIAGHTDDVGSEADNQLLSERRAESVKRWFIEHGIAESRMIAKGYGTTRPRVVGTTAEARAQNRRVEFVLIGARPE